MNIHMHLHPALCHIGRVRETFGCRGELMKKRRVLAGLMGVLAAVGAAATLQLGLTAPGKETAVLKMDPRVMEQAQ